MRFLDRREHISLVLLGGAVALGGAGLPLGPGWVVVGVVVGPFIALAAAVIVQVLTTTDPGVIAPVRHREALVLINREMATVRVMAKIWPGQWRKTLAQRLLDRSMALHAALRNDEALASAEEGVAIYRGLAADRRGKPVPGLAMALNKPLLSAQGRRPPRGSPGRCAGGSAAEPCSCRGPPEASEAAEVLILYGQMLCDLSRPREAGRPVAQGWRLATSREREHPRFARAVLRTVYEDDPSGFLAIWRTETGTDLPRWLTEQDGASPETPG
ncbi:MAG TPA: hypothetical protein VGI66_16260 [Streptosporangiaceae bacterium]